MALVDSVIVLLLNTIEKGVGGVERTGTGLFMIG